jgi:hypothetical protein
MRGRQKRFEERIASRRKSEKQRILADPAHMMSGRYKEITRALNNAAVRCENAELRIQILEKMIADAAILCLGVEDRLWSEYETTHPLRVQRLKHRDTVEEISDSSMMLGLIKHSVAVSNRLIDDGMNQLDGVAGSINKLAASFEERDVLQEIPDLSHMSLEQLSNLRQKLVEPPAHRGRVQLPQNSGAGAKDADSIHDRQRTSDSEARLGSESDSQSDAHSRVHATPHHGRAVSSRETSTPAQTQAGRAMGRTVHRDSPVPSEHETGHSARRGTQAERHAPRD